MTLKACFIQSFLKLLLVNLRYEELFHKLIYFQVTRTISVYTQRQCQFYYSFTNFVQVTIPGRQNSQTQSFLCKKLVNMVDVQTVTFSCGKWFRRGCTKCFMCHAQRRGDLALQQGKEASPRRSLQDDDNSKMKKRFRGWWCSSKKITIYRLR